MIKQWPNWILINYINKDMIISLSLLPFSRARTRAILRIGPHKDVLSIIICGSATSNDLYARLDTRVRMGPISVKRPTNPRAKGLSP